MRVSSAEFLKQYGALSDQALSEPITITRNGRDRLVLLSVSEFERMKTYAPRARFAHELSKDEIDMIARARVPEGHDRLNALLDD